MPLIKKILQICIVSADVKAMMERYEQHYGIGPWQFTDGKKGMPPEEKAVGLATRGVPGDFEITIAKAMVGDLEIELIQPLDDVSDYARFLKEKGEGVHHICIEADHEGLKSKMQEREIEKVLTGTIPGVVHFDYYDTVSDLGTIIEILSEPEM